MAVCLYVFCSYTTVSDTLEIKGHVIVEPYLTATCLILS